MKLFKYVVSDRIDILQNQYNRFIHQYALIDPFESLPFYSDHINIHPLAQLAKFSKLINHYMNTGDVVNIKCSYQKV